MAQTAPFLVSNGSFFSSQHHCAFAVLDFKALLMILALEFDIAPVLSQTDFLIDFL
jgi:hypothetical protein